MANIIDSKRQEVLTHVTVDEYSSKLTIQRQNDGDLYIYVEIPDPARKERDLIRSLIVEHKTLLAAQDDEGADEVIEAIPLSALEGFLDKRDESNAISYGANKGKPRMHSTQWWLGREIVKVIEQLVDGSNISYEVNKALAEVQS